MLQKFAITNTIFVKSIISDMHHRITYMYINFQQNWFNRSVKTVHTNIFPENCKLHKFAPITKIYVFKSITSDMHSYKTYMYFNFQQNRVCRSVKTVHTNLFERNHKLHKFATTNRIVFKSTLSDMLYRKTCMYINFQPNRVSTSVKTVHMNLFAKKLQIA